MIIYNIEYYRTPFLLSMTFCTITILLDDGHESATNHIIHNTTIYYVLARKLYNIHINYTRLTFTLSQIRLFLLHMHMVVHLLRLTLYTREFSPEWGGGCRKSKILHFLRWRSIELIRNAYKQILMHKMMWGREKNHLFWHLEKNNNNRWMIK